MLRRSLLPLVVAPALLIPAAPAAAKNCGDQSLSYAKGLGLEYVVQLKTKSASCGKGRKVVSAYHNGDRSPKGYSCSKKSLGSSPTNVSAKVTCKKGGKRVSHIFQKNK